MSARELSRNMLDNRFEGSSRHDNVKMKY